jgi:thiol-disulfide isomerase/thioredoxin
MKKIPVVFLAALLLLTGCARSQSKAAATEFQTFDLESNLITQDIFSQKKLTMLNIWATFCGPCIDEMPELGKLSTELKDADVQIIGLVADVADQNGRIVESQVTQAKQIVEGTAADYTHLLPSDGFINELLGKVYAVPTTYFFDSAGNQVGEPVLGSQSKSEWEAEISARLELLDEKT